MLFVNVFASKGFLLPWLKKSGTLKKNFDFSLPCVTTMSIDIHKYGYGPKGQVQVFADSGNLNNGHVIAAGGFYCGAGRRLYCIGIAAFDDISTLHA